MATTLTSTVKMSVVAKLHNDSVDIGEADYNVSQMISKVFANGSASGQANGIWTDERTIGISANDDIDFAGGVNDVFGTALTFTAIKAILIEADADNAVSLIVGGDTTTNIAGLFGADTDTLLVKPGASVLLMHPTTGYTVTATTADKLRLTNSSGSASITYKISVIGVKA